MLYNLPTNEELLLGVPNISIKAELVLPGCVAVGLV